MGLGTRIYVCDRCGLTIDRDLNAALNLEQLATGSSSASRTPGVHNACGESVRPGLQAVLVEAGTERQSTPV
jgi:putative transposase